MVYVMSWSIAWLDEPFTRVWDLGAKISSRDKRFAMAWLCWVGTNDVMKQATDVFWLIDDLDAEFILLLFP